MYASRKDKRNQRINLNATDLFRARCEYLAEKHGKQMTTWVYEYMARRIEEEFGADFEFQEIGKRAI